ncbi:MAG: ParB N-terminal domain-containing protein [Chromatiales bacterium]|nr:ParB N-terminal domain-containing protein [Chromatiales bacterium]
MNGSTPDLFGNDEVQIRLPVIVPLAQLKPNPWNPNKVARPELDLLKRSILKSGFCFPIVVIQESETSYMIVDGFHRHLVAQQLKMTHVPVVILDDPPSELMAATIRFNRARGTHQIDQMSNIVADLVQMGLADSEVAKNLGMDADEILRLKQNSGIAELFRDHQWSTAWEPNQ